MALRRAKITREVAHLVHQGAKLIDMPPDWAFTLDSPDHGSLRMDFNPLRAGGRENLARSWRDAVWSLRHVNEVSTLKAFLPYSKTFFRFLDDYAAPEEAVIADIRQIDRRLLDHYLAWLGHQTVGQGKQRGQFWGIGTQLVAWRVVKTILVNRRRMAPESMHPQLSFPTNPFPRSGQRIAKRQPYSEAESRRILAAVHSDMREIHDVRDGPGPARVAHMQTLAAYLIALGLATGRNVHSLLEMRRDCLSEHPAPGREMFVTFKRRGGSDRHASTFKKEAGSDLSDAARVSGSIPTSVGNHIRWLMDFTKPMAQHAPKQFKDRVFLRFAPAGVSAMEVVPVRSAYLYAMLETFVRRHRLLDDDGRALALSIARLRPTFAMAILTRTGDLVAVQRALNHASVMTTARHYADVRPDNDRDHSLVVEGMVGWARREVRGKALIAADARVPISNVQDLLSGGYNTGIARCRNPFRENDDVCAKFFTCFRCQNMVVFEEDLWRLFSFYYRLLTERLKIPAHQWVKTYGPIIKRIDMDIAPQFADDLVRAAREKAQRCPHPTWRAP